MAQTPDFLQKFQTSMDKLSNINAIIQKNIQDKQNFSSMIINNLSEINKKIRSLADAIKGLKSQVDDLKNQVNNNSTGISDKESQIKDLQTQISQLNTDKQALVEQYNTLKDKTVTDAADKQKTIDNYEAQIQKLTSDNDAMSKQVEALNNELSGKGDMSAKHAEELQKQAADFQQKMNDQITQNQAKIDSLTKSIEEKDQQINTLQQELQKAKDETASHIQTITDTQNQSTSSISQLQQQVETLKQQNNDLIQRIINATQAINEAIQNLDTLSNNDVDQKNAKDIDNTFAAIEASIQEISAAIQGQNQPKQTNTVTFPPTTPVVVSGQQIQLGEAIDGLKRKASQISDPNNKYAKTLSAIYAATNIDEINQALRNVEYKNGKITGGKSKKNKKVKKQKGGFKYNEFTKRKSLTSSSGTLTSSIRNTSKGKGINKKTSRK